jgi:hypothetical protein
MGCSVIRGYWELFGAIGLMKKPDMKIPVFAGIGP